MAHTSRLSGPSDAYTAAPVQTLTPSAPENEAAVFERAAAGIRPSWAHLIAPADSRAAGARDDWPPRAPASRANDSRPDSHPWREASAPFANPVGGRGTHQPRRRRDDDSFAEFPRALRGRRSAAFWLALVALAALGLAWALSDESTSERDTRATTSPGSPDRDTSAIEPGEPALHGESTSVNARALRSGHAIGLPNHNFREAAPATPGSEVTSSAGARSASSRTDAPRAAERVPSLPALPPHERSLLAPVSGSAIAADRTANAKFTIPMRPAPALDGRAKKISAMPLGTPSGSTNTAVSARATALALKAEAAQATAELSMQVPAAPSEPMVGRPLGIGAIHENPYDDAP